MKFCWLPDERNCVTASQRQATYTVHTGVFLWCIYVGSSTMRCLPAAKLFILCCQKLFHTKVSVSHNRAALANKRSTADTALQ